MGWKTGNPKLKEASALTATTNWPKYPNYHCSS
jgi:hypothetical protein